VGPTVTEFALGLITGFAIVAFCIASVLLLARLWGRK
jgi:hypothetical protein